MDYLTYSEYLEFGCADFPADEFKNLIAKASGYIDSQTRDFYQLNDLEEDIAFRRDKFKKAVALQVEYMHLSGASNSYEANTPQSWSIGCTSVSETSRSSNTGRNEAPSIISDDAILALSGTGLLYRGSGVMS